MLQSIYLMKIRIGILILQCLKNLNSIISLKIKFRTYLAPNTKYTVEIFIKLPENPQNQFHSIFSITTHFYTHQNQLIASSTRSLSFPYHSPYIRYIRTLFLSPLYIYGIITEIEIFSVKPFTWFYENKKYPLRKIDIYLSNKDVDIYEGNIEIRSKLTGLKWFISNFKYVIGITYSFLNALFFTFLSLLILLIIIYFYGNLLLSSLLNDDNNNITISDSNSSSRRSSYSNNSENDEKDDVKLENINVKKENNIRKRVPYEYNSNK